MPVIAPPPAGTTVSLRLVGGTSSVLDLTQYLILVEGEGFDPSPDFLEPQFNESSFGAGQGLINIDANNKEMAFPLHLKAATKDSLHTLFRTLRLKLNEPEVLVEWRDEGASLVTYFDLEYGRFNPEYRFHRARHHWIRGVLGCWCRPYGHTATDRIVGTALASGHGAPVVTIAPLSGDTDANAQYKLTVASYGGQGDYEIVAAAVLPNTSYPFRWPAASLTLGGAGASRIGASGAAGSQFIGRVAVATGSDSLAILTFTNQGLLGGDHRIMAIARHGQASPIRMSAPGVGTVTISATAWSLVDFGVLRIPSHVASYVAEQHIVPLGPSAALVGSYRVQINEVYLLPEGKTAALRTLEADLPRYVLDGVKNIVVQGTADDTTGQDVTSSLRGVLPAIPPAATVAIGMLRAPHSDSGELVAPSQSVSVEIRARERFTFQR